MRILIGALLVIISHTLTAGCPKMELYELTQMTKEELVITYCTNISDYDKDKCIYDAWMRVFTDTVKVGALGIADAAKNEARQYHDKMTCDKENHENAFRVLHKEHGTEKIEDIKCDK